MLIYIAMLRGINVSGQKIIKMERLRASFEALGFLDVRTYGQSGNTIFEAAKVPPASLTKRISEQILRHFGFSVRVILKTSNEMREIVNGNPFLKERAIDHSKLHVTFLSASPPRTALKHLNVLAATSDQFRITGQEIYLYCPNGYGRSALSNSAFERILSVGATTRSWKTVQKLLEMASG